MYSDASTWYLFRHIQNIYGRRLTAMLLALTIIVICLAAYVVCLRIQISSLQDTVKRHEHMIMSQTLAVGKHTNWLNN